jgi:hypothetical protein
MPADIRSGSTRAGPCHDDQYCLGDSRCWLGDCTPEDRRQITQFFNELVQVIEKVTKKTDGDSLRRPLLDQES